MEAGKERDGMKYRETPVFFAKSAESLENKRVEILESAKGFAKI